jgi:hypothetical protein
MTGEWSNDNMNRNNKPAPPGEGLNTNFPLGFSWRVVETSEDEDRNGIMYI